MKNIDAIAEQIEREMDEKDAVRELALKSSRAVIRLAGSAIRGLHRKEDVAAIMHEMREELAKMLSILKGHPDLYYSGFVENAFAEFSEASIVMAVLRGSALPGPKDLGVTPGAYLMGMGDAVGEFRRLALNCLREGRVKQAFEHLKVMEDIHTMLMRFDYPDALLSVRRHQDVSRSLVEKTSSEITLSARTHELEKKLGELQAHLQVRTKLSNAKESTRAPKKGKIARGKRQNK